MLRRLFWPAASRDGQAAAVQQAGFQAGHQLAAAAPHRDVRHPESIVAAALAQKVLHGWMQNRLQTRYPLALNLGNQAPGEATLVAAAVRAALDAVGADPAGVRQAAAWLATVGGTLPEAAGDPLAELLKRGLGPHAYAACAGALGRRTAVNRRYLDFLAARLDLPDEAARSLNRRFGG